MSVETPGTGGMHGDERFPTARSAGLIVTKSDGELIIYDVAAKHIHQLNAVSAAVWRQCDGRRTMSEIGAAASAELGATVNTDAVALALAKFDDANLLTQTANVPRESRRRFARKAALFGVAAVPAVVSITAPLASAAASSCKGDPENPIDSCGNKSNRVGLCCRYSDVLGQMRVGKCSSSLVCIPLA